MRSSALFPWWLMGLMVVAWGIWPSCATSAWAHRQQIPPWSPVQEASHHQAHVMIRQRTELADGVRYDLVLRDVLADRPAHTGIALAVIERPHEAWVADVDEKDFSPMPPDQGRPVAVLMSPTPHSHLTSTHGYPDQVLVEGLSSVDDRLAIHVAWRRVDGSLQQGRLLVRVDPAHRRLLARLGDAVVTVPMYALCVSADIVMVAVAIPVLLLASPVALFD